MTANAFETGSACPAPKSPLYWSFWNTGGTYSWVDYPTAKTTVAQALDNWEVVRSPVGGQLVDAVQLPDNTIADFRVVIEQIDTGMGGKVTCGSNNKIRLDIFEGTGTVVGSNANISGLAAHEMGHAFDLSHSGDVDSYDAIANPGYYPDTNSTMGTCDVLFSVQGSLAQDDWANLEWMYSSKNNMNANSSFETGSHFPFWGTSNGATASVQAGGASDGSYYLLLGGSTGGYIYQTIRVSDPADIKARVNFRKHSASSTGQVYYAMYVRRVDYPLVTNCTAGSGVDFPNGWDLNQPNLINGTGFSLCQGLWVTPNTSWQWPDTPACTTVDPWEGVDIQLRVYNYMELSGQGTEVRIDHARVRHS